MCFSPKPLAVCVACWLMVVLPAPAVILYRTGDPNQNKDAPTGDLAGSGWQYEGEFSAFLGTPIGPKHFITAAHFYPDTAITFGGVTYPVAQHASGNAQALNAYYIPGSDLVIFQIVGTFPTYAPLWSKPGEEVGKSMVVIGRGTQRGSPILTGANNHLDGWGWGPGDGVRRWGENTVVDVVQGLLHATFDADGGPNEATLSVGDSGGAVFIRDSDGLWKLAGINYAVDGPYYRMDTPNPPTAETNPNFSAALFDGAGLFEYDPSPPGVYVPAAGPNGFYSSQISSRLDYINVVLGKTPLAKIGNDVLFGFASESGKRYRVERCDDLTAGAWTTVADNLDGNGGTVLVTDAGAAGLAHRFYRVATLPSP